MRTIRAYRRQVFRHWFLVMLGTLAGIVLLPGALETFFKWPHPPRYAFGYTHGFRDAAIGSPVIAALTAAFIAWLSKPGDSADPARKQASKIEAGAAASHEATHLGDHD